MGCVAGCGVVSAPGAARCIKCEIDPKIPFSRKDITRPVWFAVFLTKAQEWKFVVGSTGPWIRGRLPTQSWIQGQLA